MGLIGEHDYAVENLDSATDGSARNLLIKNPWCDGPVMAGTRRARPQESEGDK